MSVAALLPPVRRALRAAHQLVHHCLDLACPEFCAGCRQNPARALLCPECLSDQGETVLRVRFLPGDVPAYAPWAYTDAVRSALHRFKFEAQPELARRAAAAITRSLPDDLKGPQHWVPVPLSHSRLLERGYNQAALLARELAIATCSPTPRHWLTRTDVSVKQSRLDRKQRFLNAEGAFHATLPQGTCSPSTFILVDDVVTTGATAAACCAQLSARGHVALAVVSLAHA